MFLSSADFFTGKISFLPNIIFQEYLLSVNYFGSKGHQQTTLDGKKLILTNQVI